MNTGFCSKCGAPKRGGSRFCPKCGMAYGDTQHGGKNGASFRVGNDTPFGGENFATFGAQKRKIELWHILTVVAVIVVVGVVTAIIALSGRGGAGGGNGRLGGGSASPERNTSQSGAPREDTTDPTAVGEGGQNSQASGAGQPTDGQSNGGGFNNGGFSSGGSGTGGATGNGGFSSGGSGTGGSTGNGGFSSGGSGTGGTTGNGVPASPVVPVYTVPPTLGELLGSGAAVQYQRIACADPALGCEAARSVAPSNWYAGGQAYWTMQSGLFPAMVDFYIESPDNTARAGWVSGMSYVQLDQNSQLTDGQWHSGSLAPVRTFQDAQTYAQSIFMDYTGISNMQLIDVQYPDDAMRRNMEQYIAHQYAETNAMLEQMAPVAAAQNAYYNFDHYADAAQVTLRFELNGVPCRAKVFVLISATLNTYVQQFELIGQVSEQQLHWNSKLGFYYYMAQEDLFNEHEAVSEMFFSNLIVNEQWGGAVRQVSEEMFRRQLEASFEQVQQSQQAMQQYGAQAVAQSSQNYYQSAIDNRSDAIHNVMDGWTNVISGQDYFAGADGAPVLLDNSYSHTYSDGAGNFVQSNDPWDTPYGWNEVNGSSMWPG